MNLFARTSALCALCYSLMFAADSALKIGEIHDRELSILERRERGEEWEQIARELGGSPGALRVRLSRAAARIARQLGLDGDGDA